MNYTPHSFLFRLIRLSSFAVLLLILSCSKGKVKHTTTGMKYIQYTETNGKKPQAGDWVTLAMTYKDAKDSVLYDSRGEGRPLRFQLRKPPFAGSFEEGLTYLSEGDSATFFISSDSLYAKVINADINASPSVNPAPGKFFKFDVVLHRVQSSQDAEMEIAENERQMADAEQKALEQYLKEKNITAELQPEGYYYIIDKPGKGTAISKGTAVRINYTGRFLNGQLFDSNERLGGPYIFTVGDGDVIRGWDIAFQKLHEGDKATLIIPSPLAYAEEGLTIPGSARLADYIVPPFTTLVFEVEILPASPLSNK